MPEIKQLKMREDLFWLTVLEVPVHADVPCCFWTCSEATLHGREHRQSKLLGNKERPRRSQGPNISSEGMPPYD
jgi:hypothetical protein